MGIGVLGIGVAVIWLLIALLPLRSPSARRGLAAFVLGVSALLVALAALYVSNEEVSSDYTGPDPTLVVILVAVVGVAPAVIASLVRLAAAKGQR
ncbi:hypothetical protein [Streptomyces sp. NPDC048442]|uniref:hypothetical protein n=1 Tax=Streptomyces sp. NPDC048442 TaxID=3154823 RepID=UPI0034276E59